MNVLVSQLVGAFRALTRREFKQALGWVKGAWLVVREDLHYAPKSFFSILSGFAGLEWKDSDGNWIPVNWEDKNPPDDPYYVCVLFYSGRHIPLPVLNGQYEEVGPLQIMAIELAEKLKPTTYKEAMEDIACYYQWWYEWWDKN